MNALERQVRAVIYRTLLECGQAPSVMTLGSQLGAPEALVVTALRALAEAHAVVLRPGTVDIWMAHPFSAIETDFVVRSGARSWFANCVWDGLAILALVGDGTLDTHSPGNSAPIRFDVRKRIVAGEGIVHFLVPAARFWDDIGFT